MPPPVRSAEREGRPNHCGRRRRACIPIPPADGSAGEVRIFYCIQGGTTHNVRDNDVCVRCENKREEHPNCRGRKCYERWCCGQRRRGRRRRACIPIPPADGSAGEVRIFYCIQGGTAHNVRDNDVCVRCENKREEQPNCRGRRRRARMPIPSAEDSAGAVRIFYCIRGGTAHNVLSDGSCARREKKKGRGVSPLQQVLEKPLMRSCPAPQPCPTLMGRT